MILSVQLRLCCFPRIKRCEKTSESEKVLGRDFTGLRQLSTQGVSGSNPPLPLANCSS